MAKEKFYITTAIDYVNDKPHLGHALEKIQADVLARYHRLMGDEVLFLTGTDEHGVKIQRAAEKARKEPQEFVDELSETFRQLKGVLNLSWDRFIRTTNTATHYPGVEKMWRTLRDKGDLEKRKYRGLYCVGHEAFIAERDLVDGKCLDHGTKPEVVEEENWFFKLSNYNAAIKEAIESGRLAILPATRKNEILSLLMQGLEDVSFSRPKASLTWGIPVPDDPEQTIYVWADALVNYISAIGYGREEKEFEQWWPAEAQVIGKDILRFHAAIWPGMLLAAGLHLPKKLLVHGFITVEDQKMSKTIGNVIDPFEISNQYGSDALRYFLLKEIPTGEDGDFSLEKFRILYNSDLANGLGNLVARIMKLAEEHLPAPITQPETEEFPAEYGKFIDSFELNRALNVVWDRVRALDEQITRTEPFKLIKEDPEKGRALIAELAKELYSIARLLNPFLPEANAKIKATILANKKPETLFPRIQ